MLGERCTAAVRRRHALSVRCADTEIADEIGAIVAEIGASTSKFGYAGEDMPKLVTESVRARHQGHPCAV